VQGVLHRDIKLANVFFNNKKGLIHTARHSPLVTLALPVSVLSHLQGVLHRDIKLANVFFDKKKSLIRLGDFGCAAEVLSADGLPYSRDAPHLSKAFNPTAPGQQLNVPALDVQQACLTVLIAVIGLRNMPWGINGWNAAQSDRELLDNCANTNW
jgi:serine/threonine protein kinase